MSESPPMASGRWITRLADRCGARLGLVSIVLIATNVQLARAAGQNACEKPVYLTLDTGHMGVAPMMAEVLRRQDVRVTFFAAHEKTQEGDGSLGAQWAPWWKARAAEGHEFASHTYDHVYWRGDVAGP